MQSAFLMVSLLQGFYWFDNGLQSYMRARGWPALTAPQSMVMLNISIDIVKPAEIARRLGISRQAVFMTLKQMEDLNIIRLESDPLDKRSKIIKLTEMGQAMHRDAQDSHRKLLDELGQRIGTSHVVELTTAFGRNWGEDVNFEEDPTVSVAPDAPSS